MANSFSISADVELAALAVLVQTVDTVVDLIRSTDVPAIVSEVDDNESLLNALGIIVTDIHDTDLPAVNTNVSGNETKIDTAITDIGALENISTAQVGVQVGTVLDTAIPGTPTADSINDILKDLDSKFPAGGISGVLSLRGTTKQHWSSEEGDAYTAKLTVTGSGKLIAMSTNVADQDSDREFIEIEIDGVTYTPDSNTGAVRQNQYYIQEVETVETKLIGVQGATDITIPQLLNFEFKTGFEIRTRDPKTAGGAKCYLFVTYIED